MVQKSKQNGIVKYYGLLRVVLVLLIIVRLLGIISMIAQFNKPVNVEIVAILNDRAYKISALVGSILDIILLVIFYKIVSM